MNQTQGPRVEDHSWDFANRGCSNLGFKIFSTQKMVLYSTKRGSWLVIIGEPLLVLYRAISLKVLYSTFVKWCNVEP